MNRTNGFARLGALAGVVVAAFMWFGAARGLAQTDASGSDARALFMQGEQAYRVGNYEEAVSLWERAYQADPRPRIQYNLSQAYERLGRLEEAVRSLDIYVRATSPDEPLYGEANARLSALRQRVALTGIRILGGASGSQIFVDEQPWGATPRPDRIPVSPGNHTVAIVSPTGSRREIAVAVPVGQVVDVNVPAGQDSSPVISVSDPSQPGGNNAFGGAPAEPRGHGMLYAGIGAAGAGLLVLSYGIARQVTLGGCSDSGYTCLNESPVRTQRSLGLALGATLLAAGGALIVVDLVRGDSSTADVDLGIGTASLSLTVRR